MDFSRYLRDGRDEGIRCTHLALLSSAEYVRLVGEGQCGSVNLVLVL